MTKRITRKVALIACFLGVYSLIMAQTSPASKISPAVLTALTQQATTTYIVDLGSKADLSPALQLDTKAEKGQFVYQTLVAHANATQGNVINTILAGAGTYQSFFINNTIAVNGNYALLQALAALPEVSKITPNTKIQLHEKIKDDEDKFMEKTRLAVGPEWGVMKIKAPDVWAMGFNGQGVVIGGADSGYEWGHPALKAKYRGWNGTTANHNYNWHDCIHLVAPPGGGCTGADQTAPCDDNEHGTHTMGTMCGDDGVGNQVGVAPGSRWIGTRALVAGLGVFSTYMEGFQWMLAPTNIANAMPDPSKAPDVMNNSWGCVEGCSEADYDQMENAIKALRMAGVVVVGSAGNDGSNCSTIITPLAIFESTFTVGSTTSADAISSFSSRGPVLVDQSMRRKPNVSAPGSTVRSSVLNGMYDNLSGTSMAGPHVCGAVALVISARPALKGKVDLIENILEQTSATTVTNTQTCGGTGPTTYPNNTFGFGRIDALAAVQLALSTALPVTYISFRATSENNSAVRLAWATATELNAQNYIIEHSPDAKTWTQIGDQKANGSSNTRSDYEFLHQNPSAGMNYYRLIQHDFDDKTNISSTVFASINASKLRITAFPNPTNGEVKIAVTSDRTIRLQARIFNLQGQEVYRQSGEADYANPLNLNISALAQGSYLLQTYDMAGNRIAVQRLTKM